MIFRQQIQIPTAERAAYDSTQINYKLMTSLNTFNETQIRFNFHFWHDPAPHKVDYSIYGWSSIGLTYCRWHHPRLGWIPSDPWSLSAYKTIYLKKELVLFSLVVIKTISPASDGGWWYSDLVGGLDREAVPLQHKCVGFTHGFSCQPLQCGGAGPH